MARYALESVIVILVVLWVVGAFVYTTGGATHLLLFAALGGVMGRIFQGRRPADRFP
jgi:hypothetical protein